MFNLHREYGSNITCVQLCVRSFAAVISGFGPGLDVQNSHRLLGMYTGLEELSNRAGFITRFFMMKTQITDFENMVFRPRLKSRALTLLCSCDQACDTDAFRQLLNENVVRVPAYALRDIYLEAL